MLKTFFWTNNLAFSFGRAGRITETLFKVFNHLGNQFLFPWKCLVLIFLTFFLTLGVSEAADSSQANKENLVDLSFEELMDIKVTSASKKEQSLSQAPSAIFVITQEDLRRSGATTVPEALRMVPGVQVAQVDSNKWAVTARGFNELFARKLLIMIDGRSVYSPLFSGVYWDVQDTVLEDIDRIEVIRGPGGTLWGANAVNGVINIITKNSKETQGTLLSAGAGTVENGFGSIRYGGQLSDKAHYRVFAKYFNRDAFEPSPGIDGGDEWKALRGGFRMDWDSSEENSWTVQGDYYNGVSGQRVTEVATLSPPFFRTTDDDVQVSGGNILARWKHTHSKSSSTTLQVFYDRTERKALPLEQSVDTFDLDFQHRLDIGDRHDFIWGFGQRLIYDDLDNTFTTTFTPGNRLNHTTSAFVQDDITLKKDRLHLILGSKFELNSYTGFEFQPNARVLWTPHGRHTVWASVSRAVRTPARTEDSFRLNFLATPGGGLNNLFSTFGTGAITSEDLLAYELGYRVQPTETVFLDITTFYNSYHNLVTAEPQTPFVETTPTPAHLVIPTIFQNNMTGDAFGIEIAGNWKVFNWWELNAAYSLLVFDLDLSPGSGDTSRSNLDGRDPNYQFNIRSHMDLPRNFEFDLALYFIDKLDALNVPSYTRLDTRLGWLPTETLEVSLFLQNLLDPQHPEFGGFDGGITTTEIPRSIYGKVIWKF